MTKRYLVTVSISGLWAILMTLLLTLIFSGEISAEKQSLYNTALMIHLIHTVALLSLTFMNRFVSRSYLNILYYFFTVGIVLFSGSLYLISIEELTKLIIGFLAYLVPLGGISLLGGWFVLLFTGVTYKHKKRAIHNS